MADTSDIKNLIEQLRRVTKNFSTRSRRAIVNAVHPLVVELQKVSPVRSGAFRSAWSVSINQSAAGIIATIYNRKHYSVAIETGSEIGERPWPSAVPPPKGSTVEYEGKIFPHIAPGGPINIVFKKFDWNKFHQNVADQLIGDIHG